MTAVVQARPEGLPLAAACRALGLNRSSVYARQQASGLSEEARTERRSRRGCVQPRALTPEERQTVRAALYSPEYHDQPPAEVHAALLAQGQYLGSLSTFHRILRADAAQGPPHRTRSGPGISSATRRFLTVRRCKTVATRLSQQPGTS
jgi:putative transposase